MKRRSREKTEHTNSNESQIVAAYHRQFSIIHLFFGLMNGATMFNAVYLKSSGLSATQVGLFISISSLVGMFAPMFWGMMSDRYKTVKKIIYITLSLMLITYFPIPIYSRVFIGATTLAPILIVVQAAFAGTPEGMLTTWIMQTQRQHPDVQYGVIRMFFTGAFALSNFMYMLIIELTSIDSIFIGYGIFAVAIMILLIRYKDIQPLNEDDTKIRQKIDVGSILKNKIIISYMIFMMFAWVPSSSLGLFTPYLIEEIGSDSSVLGGMIAIRSLAAVPILFFSNRLIRRLKPFNTLLIGSSLFCISQLIFVFARTITHITLNCVLMGVALGILMPSEVSFINEQAQEGLLATTQTVCGTVYSLAGILCSYLGGIVVDTLGIRQYYFIVVCLTAAATIYFAITTAIIKRHSLSSETA